MKHKKLIIIIAIILIIALIGLFVFIKNKNNNVLQNFRNFEAGSRIEGQMSQERKTMTTTISASGEISSALIEQIEPHATYYLGEILVSDNQYVEKDTNLIKYTNGYYLTAPYDSVITEINLPQTNEKILNSHYIQIESVKMLTVSMKVDEEQINNISIGNEAKITVSAIESTYTGYITHISSTAQNGKFTITIEFENDNKIKLGMTADILLTINM